MRLSDTHVHTLSIGWCLQRWRSQHRCHLNSFNRGWLTEDEWRTGGHLNCQKWARNPALHSYCLLQVVLLNLNMKSEMIFFMLNHLPLLFQLSLCQYAFATICEIRFTHLCPKTWQRKSFFLNCKSVITTEGKYIPRRRRSELFYGP